MAKRKPARPGNARPSRSKKAGSPPSAVNSSPRVRRRRKRAHAALSKGTTLFATDHGPRAAWPASASKRKKR
ncbi:MAG: hypothetical protein ACREJV_12475 [Candidatus Rokuibacteriota bacterium]